MRLLLAHPEVAARSCDDCRRFLYQDTRERLSPKKVLQGDGSPMPRVVPDSMPCHQCPKIPKGAVPRGERPGPEHAVELSGQNAQAYWHYQECKAVGQFPDDPIVRRNAAIIRGVEEDLERERTDLTPLLTLLMARG